MLSGCFNINLLPIFQSLAVQSQSTHPYTPLIESVQLLVLGVYNRLLKTCFKEKYGADLQISINVNSLRRLQFEFKIVNMYDWFHFFLIYYV